MEWNHDITAAPRGKMVKKTRHVPTKTGAKEMEVETFVRDKILAVHPEGLVSQSYWIPPIYTKSGEVLEGDRWSGFNRGTDPIAWAPWPTYDGKGVSNGCT